METKKSLGYKIQKKQKGCWSCKQCKSSSSTLQYPPITVYNCKLIPLLTPGDKNYGYSGNVSSVGICDMYKKG